VLIVAAGWLGVAGLAQDVRTPPTSFVQQQRLADEQVRRERRALAPVDALLDWEWGGWVEYYVFHFSDGLQESRLFQRPGMSVWTRVLADDEAHEVFARVKVTFERFSEGDEYDRRKDWVGPNFDRLWYQIDVGRALRLIERGKPYELKLRAGRQEVLFGTGYALDLPLDAVVLEGRWESLRVTGLFGRTIGSFPNVDRSAVVQSHSDRDFYGAQLTYAGLPRHEPFVYAVWNQDHTDERPRDRFQAYSYDTAYFGMGSRGQITRGLSYWAEGVFETGQSFPDSAIYNRESVAAYGLNGGLEYAFEHAMRPRVSLEYMFASGDADRVLSPTNALGGNRRGTRDRSFVGFGYRDTGIALAPALSNLHVVRAGGIAAPFPEVEPLRDLELGTNWFLYHKHQSSAAISDITADSGRGFVGWEMDYFVNWRFASDLAWTVRWGVFFPGNAYTDRDARNFVFTGITWSF